MAEKIFLERNRNIESLNKENKINLNLTQKARLLPYNEVSDKLNLAELFSDERDACDKYRLIFTVNPICTNVLYNMKTEVVMKEGSSECRALVGEEGFSGDSYITIPKSNISARVTSTVNPVDHLQAIRDTEYSHPNVGGLTYHCGLDIFNNHMLRSKGFVHINRLKSGGVPYEKCSPIFNTIFDLKRDGNGDIINEELAASTNTGKTDLHVYHVDNIMSFEEAYAYHMTEKDGWFGFNNVGYIEIPNASNGKLSVNKLMNNNKACEFIDMYPDRSLYSFIPKRNIYRSRVERNWDYCITYPYESDYDKFNEVMGFDFCARTFTYAWNKGEDSLGSSIRANVTTGKTSNGFDCYVFKTVIKHNLTYGDTVRITPFRTGTSVSEIEITISGLGDVDGTDKEHCFRIYTNQINNGLPNLPNSKLFFPVWVRRLSNSTGCVYYFRKFKKILNSDGSELNSSIGKLAFGENIYGDRVAEVIYTDDINVGGLKDNLGRPLSEIYFTVVKTNRGHDLWYEENKFSDIRVEYSHCFGDVTSGIDMINEETNYNVRKLHNVHHTGVTKYTGFTKGSYSVRDYHSGLTRFMGNLIPPKAIETGITEDKFDEFYGDIVEFDPSTNKETVLEVVYHRFNTAQRELCKPGYYDLRYDILIGDDFDTGTVVRSGNTQSTYNGFTVLSDETGRDLGVSTAQKTSLSGAILRSTYLNSDGNSYFFPGNIQPEGYFYQPHHRIKIREISDVANTQVGALITFNAVNAYSSRLSETSATHFIEVKTKDNYGYVVGDLFGVYNKLNGKLSWGVLDAYTEKVDEETGDKYILLKMEVSTSIELQELNGDRFEIVLTNGSVPSYASYMPKEQKFVWRDVLAPSEVSSTNPLSDLMFTNGANYIHTNVNFYVRRQDPFGSNGLLVPKRDSNGNDASPLKKYKRFGVDVDLSQLLYLAIDTQNACL